MNRLLVLCVLVLAFGSLLGGCGGGGDNNNPPGFGVSSTSPSADQADVLVTASVSATFSGDVDCATVNASTFAVKDAAATAVTGSYSCAGATATFTPAQYLSFSALYSAAVTTAVKDTSGNSLANVSSWSFRTKKGVVAIRTGGAFNMARDSEGAVFTWGADAYGLGRPSDNTNVTTPLAVSVPAASAIGVGESHAFVTTTAGAVYGWGGNFFGQVGNGATADLVGSPTIISGITGTVKDFAGSVKHTLALTQDGAVWAWGNNCKGQLGDNSTADRLSPVRVQFPAGTVITAIDAANDNDAPCAAFSMALDNGGNVWVWGTNTHWQLAQPNSTDASPGPDEALVPTKVAGLANATAIAAGWRFAAAVSNGSVYTWGDGSQGALGDNTCGVDHHAFAPVQVSGLANVTKISATRFGYQFTLALKSDRTVWGWGDNSSGQLGDNSTGIDNACTGIATPMRGRMTPVQAAGLTNVIDVRAGAYHSLALKNDGKVWAWGDNTDGLLGKDVSSATTVLTPTQVPGL